MIQTDALPEFSGRFLPVENLRALYENVRRGSEVWMLKFEIREAHLPRWMVPVLVLAALALIPFALMLALGLAAVAVGLTALRILLPPAKPPEREILKPRASSSLKPGSVIDADYEVKDENEKE
jgi:hypothetical protein